MSFCAGTYLDHKSGQEGLPSVLFAATMLDGIPASFIPGRIAHITPPNAKTQIMIDTPLGKGSGIFFGFLWQMRKRGFVVDKVDEWLEISPVHTQYYQITVQQKQNLEQQIKSALAGIQTSISDYELLHHDIRKYTEYMRYFDNIEKGKKTKDSQLEFENNQTLKSIFIDQVDVHTGEGVALKLIASRWPTIIVDFMKINDKDTDPKKIAKDYGFSEAEGVVLATKNKIYQEWKSLFKQSVTSRYKHLTELVGARKRSISEYRNMVKPYVLRHKMIKEFGETKQGRKLLNDFSWWRPSTQAVSMDAAEYWIWRPFSAPEINRAPTMRVDESHPITSPKCDIPEIMKYEAKKNWSRVKGAGFGKLKTFVTGIEPLDDYVWWLKDELLKYYKKNFNYRATLDIVDILEARKNLENKYTEYGRWDWIPSPYFMCLQIHTFRVVVRNPDGTESETFIVGSYPDRPLCAFVDTQNVMIVRELEKMLQQKEMENYVTDMVGESVDGKDVDKSISDEFAYLKGDGPSKEDFSNLKKPDFKPPIPNSFSSKFTFVRPGPYEAIFMERVAAIMVKNTVMSTYGPAVGYFKSAAGVP